MLVCYRKAMPRFYTLKISDLYKDTDDCTVITLDVPEALRPEFQFFPGQHVILKTQIEGKDVRRSYSLCSAPSENSWQLGVKQIENGLFSSYVNQKLRKGDTIEVMPPHGIFLSKVNPEISRNLIAFAAGSGITPIISIIKAHLESEPGSTFRLFYINRNVKSIIFKEQIEALKNTYLNRFEVFYFLTREFRDAPLFNGRLTPEKINLLFKKIFDPIKIDDFFICGPEDMIATVKQELLNAGVQKEKIHFELFTAKGLTKKEDPDQRASEKIIGGAEITIIDGGKEFHFVLEKSFDNILDGALSAGADLPYACKGGVCSTCRCKVIEGEVSMKMNYSLDEEQLAQKFILSCQALPVSKKLILDFDV